MSLVGMGQLAPGPASDPTCGANPCGMFDYVWLSQTCQDYLGCADPTNALYVGATKGALALVGQTAGTAVGSTVAGVSSGLVSGISASTGVPSTLIYVGVAVAAFFLLKDLIKR